MPFQKIIFFIHCWTKELATVMFCEEELGSRRNSRCDWSNYMHVACAKNLITNPVIIRGPIMTVEIDESLFSKRKTMFVVYFTSAMGLRRTLSRNRRVLSRLADRSADTLLPIIQNGDEWCAYRGIQGLPQNG